MSFRSDHVLNSESSFITVTLLHWTILTSKWFVFRVACTPAPLGMESGAIRDSQISASSIWLGNHAAHQARLHFKAGGGKSGGWSSRFNNNNQWLQVDLELTTRVTGIATQGRNVHSQWVKQYKLEYGEDEHTFKFYRITGDHSDTVRFDSWQRRCQYSLLK